MASTATFAATALPSKPLSRLDSAHPPACPTCGTTYGEDHQLAHADKQRIAELESQVRMLSEKAAAAVDKLADYEDQLHKLRKAHKARTISEDTTTSSIITSPQTARTPADEHANPFDTTTTTPASATTTNPSRFSALLGAARKYTPTGPTLTLGGINGGNANSRRESDLQAALVREQELRQKAEGKLSQMNVEIEDLSTQLFQQANEMVATERKARARLEERVEVLEKRDAEKRKRLDRLEVAMQRIERVKGLLST